MKYTAANRKATFSFETKDSRVVKVDAGLEWALYKPFSQLLAWCDERCMAVRCHVGNNLYVISRY